MEEGDQIPSLPGFFKKSCFIHDVSFHGFTVIPSMLRISVAELRRIYSNSHLERKLQLKLRLVVIWLSTTFIMINQTVGLPGLIENNKKTCAREQKRARFLFPACTAESLAPSSKFIPWPHVVEQRDHGDVSFHSYLFSGGVSEG